MAWINTATQFVTQLGDLKMEVGYRTDVSAASGIAAADLSETHNIPTTLDYVVAGWLYTKGTGTGGALPGCITGQGPVTRDFSGDADTDADYTASAMVCFTLDCSSDGGTSGDYYLIFGW